MTFSCSYLSYRIIYLTNHLIIVDISYTTSGTLIKKLFIILQSLKFYIKLLKSLL